MTRTPGAHRALREYFEPVAPKLRLVTRGDLIDRLPLDRVPRDRCLIDVSFAEPAVWVMRMVEGDEAKSSALLMFAREAYFGPLSRARERLLYLPDTLPEVEGAYHRVHCAVREVFGLSAEILREVQAALDGAVRTELHAIERARHLSHFAMPPLERLPAELELLTASDARCADIEALWEYFGAVQRERRKASAAIRSLRWLTGPSAPTQEGGVSFSTSPDRPRTCDEQSTEIGRPQRLVAACSGRRS